MSATNQHNSELANKLDPRGGLGSSSTNHGPHDSNIANKLDPRIDSDRDNRAQHGGLTGGSNTHGATGAFSSATAGSTNHGPHDSNVANKLDPRVDSDRDGRQGHHGASGALGSSHTAGSTNHGPHDSNVANKLDPRVDSDRDGRSTHGNNHGIGNNKGTGIAGGLSSATAGSTNHGPHSTNVGNKLDPQVDSDKDHRGGLAASASGPAPNTAGPHSKDILNKLDPRVDSDLDGSKTVGNAKTH